MGICTYSWWDMVSINYMTQTYCNILSDCIYSLIYLVHADVNYWHYIVKSPYMYLLTNPYNKTKSCDAHISMYIRGLSDYLQDTSLSSSWVILLRFYFCCNIIHYFSLFYHTYNDILFNWYFFRKHCSIQTCIQIEENLFKVVILMY